MAAVFDYEIKDRVRSAIDIVELLGGYMQLRRQGANYVGQCPFHDDRRPSLHINATRQIWKCWVCDVGGDVFSFLMLREQLSFPEALEMLATRCGIELPAKSGGRRVDGGGKQDMLAAMAWVVNQYHRYLAVEADAESARDYLLQRGIDRESITSFQIGYAPDQWNWLCDRFTATGQPLSLLHSVGVAAKSERGSIYDRFRGRVIFPINDPQGRCVALGGRVLPGADRDTAKYINCAESPLYQKHQLLYNLDSAKSAIVSSRTAVVMEGYTDVIMAAQMGIPNAVAVCGTALGSEHVRVLKRYCDQVVLLLDGDDAGRRRASEILDLFIGHPIDLRIVTLPDDLDPCDYLLREGPDALRNEISRGVDALEYKVDLLMDGANPLTDTHRANAAIEQLIASLARPTPEGVDPSAMKLRREQMLLRLQRRFGLPVELLRSRLKDASEAVARREQNRQSLRHRLADPPRLISSDVPSPTQPHVAPPPPRTPLQYDSLTAIERELFEILVTREDLVPLALEQFDRGCLRSREAKLLFQLYIDNELAGQPLGFESILSLIEDVETKSLLVTIESHASRKHARVPIDARTRLLNLCESIVADQSLAQQEQRLARLADSSLDGDEAVKLLEQFIESAKTQTGIKLPKL